MRRSWIVSLSVALLASSGRVSFAQVETSTVCAPYVAAIVGDASAKQADPVAPLSDYLLKNWTDGVPCVISYLNTLQGVIKSPNLRGNDVLLTRFLRATGAVRSMMAISPNLDAVISLFRTTLSRGSMNLSVASVLTYGARSDDKNARQNSMWILANVIDNTTVCVPLDHLYDPTISPPGRANLLAIVSVVAPWAYRENYKNIEATVSFTQIAASQNPDLTDTNSILHNIEQRLQTQTNDTNKVMPIPVGSQTCKTYKLQYANSQQLSY